MNNYLSRYAKYDTHFKRTDPFKHSEWIDEDEDLPLTTKLLAGLGLVFTLIVLFFIY